MKQPKTDIQILLIEDDPMVQEVNKMFIEKVEGFTVAGVAADGQKGRKLVNEIEPDLVLLDVYMPNEDGIECIQHLREARIDIDIIAVTAANDTATIQDLLRAGVIDYIVKPFTFERMKRALTQYRQRSAQFLNREEMSQNELDEMILSGENQEQHQDELPKGLQKKTLEQVVDFLNKMETPLSAEDIGQEIGLARVTVRRYLNYLETIGKVKIELTYGQIGRPIQLYKRIDNSEESG
ncbi:response regulator [Alteribacillus bidgolensis]|uniref:Two-component system, CitB family, response regulator DctR n=1 Tax=Alteribacillus bidgolensis TaxID=930129 RepID=A0A1G8KZW1_9BACI|nr:response regulator [Alteribacillus bidgolensis]SDI48901.1 two-component system, CitB family, response regulator DctR [Alteribacillus bidgolensis]